MYSRSPRSETAGSERTREEEEAPAIGAAHKWLITYTQERLKKVTQAALIVVWSRWGRTAAGAAGPRTRSEGLLCHAS